MKAKNRAGNRHHAMHLALGLAAWALLLALPLAGAAVAGPAAPTQQDRAFMRQCIALAQASVDKGNEPFGAVLVKDGRVIMRAENTVHSNDNETHHAETNLIAAAYRKYGPSGARGATLYANCEPCPMCCGAIYIAEISRVVYGLSNGRLAKISGFKDAITAREFFALCDRKIQVTGPVLEDEAAKVIAAYLKSRRLPKAGHPHPLPKAK